MFESLFASLDFAAPRANEVRAMETKIEARALRADEVDAVAGAGGWCGTTTGVKPYHGITGAPAVDGNPAYVK